MPPIPFATESYQSASVPLAAQRVVNLYVEVEGPDKKTPRPLFGSPGMVPFAQCGNGPIRGMRTMADVLYAVSGNDLYRIDRTGNTTLISSSPIAGRATVSMSDNGKQLCIVNASKGFIWSQSAGWQPITSANFFPAATVTFFDDVFVFDRIGTNQFFISGILDGTTIPGDFGSAEVKPADVMAVLNNHETLLIFTKKIIESWYDAGTTNFPFARYDGGTIERGLAASQAVVEEDNSVFFLGDDRIFYRLDYPIPRRVSTHGTETQWGKYTTIEDAFAFSYTLNGHKFINLTFPSIPATWTFDIATGLWHERDSRDANNNSLSRWRANCFANAYGKLLVGDALSGTIAALDTGTYTELGNPMVGTAVSPPIHADRKRVFMSRYELDVQPGVGVTSGQGSDPQIMLDWSDDGGFTWSGIQQWSSMGKIGEYKKRMRWLRKGAARERIIRINISDPVQRVIMAANADLTPGAN